MNKKLLTRVGVQVPYDLIERSEAAKPLEVGQGHSHLGLVVVVLVHVRTLRVQSLR